MALRAAALMLGLLAAVTAAQADASPEGEASMLQTYIAKLHNNSRGIVQQLQGSEFSQALQEKIEAFLQTDENQWQGNTRPSVSEFFTQLKEEFGKHGEQIQQKLQELQRGISSRAPEMIAGILQRVRSDVAPHAERMQAQVSQSVADAKKTLEAAFQEMRESAGNLPYADTLQQKVEQVAQNVELAAQELKATVDHGFKELHTQISPHIQDKQAQLTLQLQGVMERTEQLRAKALEGAEGLRGSLGPALQKLREMAQEHRGKSLVDITGLKETIDGHIEDFHQKAEQLSEGFAQAVAQGMEELQSLQGVTGKVDHTSSLGKELNAAFTDILDSFQQAEN